MSPTETSGASTVAHVIPPFGPETSTQRCTANVSRFPCTSTSATGSVTAPSNSMRKRKSGIASGKATWPASIMAHSFLPIRRTSQSIRSSDFQRVTVRTTFSTSPTWTGQLGMAQPALDDEPVAERSRLDVPLAGRGHDLAGALPLYGVSCQPADAIVA